MKYVNKDTRTTPKLFDLPHRHVKIKILKCPGVGEGGGGLIFKESYQKNITRFLVQIFTVEALVFKSVLLL